MKVIRLDNPQTWNLYAYVTNNPETLNDPLGLSGGNDAFEYFNPSTSSKQDGGSAGGNSADQRAKAGGHWTAVAGKGTIMFIKASSTIHENSDGTYSDTETVEKATFSTKEGEGGKFLSGSKAGSAEVSGVSSPLRV